MKNNFFVVLLSFLFILSVFGDDLRPRSVARSGDVEVPEGMYLMVDRAGNRWLLPNGMDKPPVRIKPAEYYKADKERRVIGKAGEADILDGPISAQDTFYDEAKFWDDLPPSFANLMRMEKDLNLHGQSEEHFSFLGDYGPNSKKPFYIPYIPIPADEMEFSYISELAQEGTKDLVEFEKDGKKYHRFFIHPNYPANYEELIEKYGIVYEHVGITTSSPRSLVMMDPKKPGKVHWVKPSLPKKIDGSVRLNLDKKLRRAVIMSEALANIPMNARESYGVDFMLEPASLQPPGKHYGTIFRELHDELLNPAPGKSWLPAFALNAPGESGRPIILEMLEKSGEPDPKKFITERVVRPFLRAYLNLAYNEGLPGEFHTQNFYYELGRDGLPTGKFIFKDNDGFRFDVEIAMRRNRALTYLSKFKDPFRWAKFSNALGTGADGIPFLGSWYYKLIRNVSGFETLSSYILSVMGSRGGSTWTKDGIQKLFDDIAIEEAEKITGLKVTPEHKYGYGKNKGLNDLLHRFRVQLANAGDDSFWIENEALQARLKQIYDKLDEAGSVHTRGNLTRTTYYVAHVVDDNTLFIEAKVPNSRSAYGNPTRGLAIAEKGSDIHFELETEMKKLIGFCGI